MEYEPEARWAYRRMNTNPGVEFTFIVKVSVEYLSTFISSNFNYNKYNDCYN